MPKRHWCRVTKSYVTNRPKGWQPVSSQPQSGQRESVLLPNDLIVRAATVSPNTLSSDDRSVNAVIATDSAVPVFDPYTLEIIDEVLIAVGMQTVDRVNLLRDHNRATVLAIQGDVHTFRVNESNIEATLQFGRNLDPEAEAIYNRVEQGFLRTVSAGYAYSRSDSVEIQPGQSATVDGRTFTAGSRMMRVVRAWRLREVSLVVIPADELAQMRNGIAENGQRVTIENLSSEFGSNAVHASITNQSFRESKTMNQTTEAAAETTSAQTTSPIIDANTQQRSDSASGFQTPATNPVAPSPSLADIVAAERSRQSTIRNLAGSDLPLDIVERAMNEGWTIEQTATQFAAARAAARPQPLAAGNQAPFGHVSQGGVTLPAMQAALLLRHGVDLQSQSFRGMGAEAMLGRADVNASWLVEANQHMGMRGNFTDEASRSIDAAKKMRSWGTREFARACLALSNQNAPDDDTELFQRASSTQAWNALFTTNINAQLLMAYEETPDPTAAMVKYEDVDNFLTNERVIAGKMSGMRREGVNGGEATLVNGGLPTTETYKIDRFVGAMEYDDKAFINNRFQSLDGMTIQEMGMMAKRLPADLVFGILLSNPNMADGNPLFTGSNALTAAPLNTANLQLAWTRMGTQTQDGVNLGVFAQNLVTSVANYFNAQSLLTSVAIVGGSTAQPDKNTVAGLYGHIFDNRLDNGCPDHTALIPTMLAGAPTTWFVTAKGGRHTIEVGFLRGSGRAPRLVTKDLEGNRIGKKYLVWLDVQAKALSRLGLLRAVAT